MAGEPSGVGADANEKPTQLVLRRMSALRTRPLRHRWEPLSADWRRAIGPPYRLGL